jgi:hypothetical protein
MARRIVDRNVLRTGSTRADGEHTPTISEEARLLIENKYTAISALVGFLLMLWLTDGSMVAAFGVLALIAGAGWVMGSPMGEVSDRRARRGSDQHGT